MSPYQLTPVKGQGQGQTQPACLLVIFTPNHTTSTDPLPNIHTAMLSREN